MQQNNGYDCGVFSAFNAVTACLNASPKRPFHKVPSLDDPRSCLLRQVHFAVLRATGTSSLSLTEQQKLSGEFDIRSAKEIVRESARILKILGDVDGKSSDLGNDLRYHATPAHSQRASSGFAIPYDTPHIAYNKVRRRCLNLSDSLVMMDEFTVRESQISVVPRLQRQMVGVGKC